MKRFSATLLLALCIMALTTYCSAQDVTDDYGLKYVAELCGETADDAFDPTDDADASTAKVQGHIDAAAARINAAVMAAEGELNYDDTHPLLNSLNIEGAYLDLMRKRPGGASEDILAQHKAWLSELGKIASGELDLADPPEEADDVDYSGYLRTNKRLFGRLPLPTSS